MVKAVFPIVLVHDTSHAIIGIRQVSEKSANKSLEQGALWEVHAHTGKEIESTPLIPISQVYKVSGGYVGNVNSEQYDALSDENKALITQQALAPLSIQFPPHKHNSSAHASSLPSLDETSSTPYQVLDILQQVIQDRKTSLPEGSYTTLLFKSGGEKIRKKLGEESMELILSKDSTRIIEESADLLYHLFVLLHFEGISFSEILHILHTRFTQE